MSPSTRRALVKSLRQSRLCVITTLGYSTRVGPLPLKLTPSPLPGAFFFCTFSTFMSSLIASYQLLVDPNGPKNWPWEVQFYWTPDGKVRMNKRGPSLNLDKWFVDFDSAATAINALVNTKRYVLRGSEDARVDPFNNRLFKDTP